MGKAKLESILLLQHPSLVIKAFKVCIMKRLYCNHKGQKAIQDVLEEGVEWQENQPTG